MRCGAPTGGAANQVWVSISSTYHGYCTQDYWRMRMREISSGGVLLARSGF